MFLVINHNTITDVNSLPMNSFVQEIYNELEQAQPKVAQLIQAGEDLLEKGNDVSAQALQQNLDNLKSRWDLVTNRATEKKSRLEQALQQVSLN